MVCVVYRYDLSLNEMRALTNQRVKFVLSLPLLKHILQEQVSDIVIFFRNVHVSVCIRVSMCVPVRKGDMLYLLL